jgi:hypothetical protein
MARAKLPAGCRPAGSVPAAGVFVYELGDDVGSMTRTSGFRLADLGRVNDWAVEGYLWIPSRKQLALMAQFLALNALAVISVRLW